MEFSRFETFASLRHRNFRLFFSGQLISLIGTWMQAMTLSWLVLVLTGSAFYLGLVGALQTLPILLFSFFAGVVADRTNKYRLLFLTQGTAMVLAFVLGVLVAEAVLKLWLLCLLVFLVGSAFAFDIPVRQAFIVELVGKADLPNAIALNSSLFNATRVAGPAIAGILIAKVGMANCFFLNAASFLAVLLALMLIQLPPARQAPPLPFRQAWRELLDYLLARPELKVVLGLMTVSSLFAMPYYVLLPLFARDTLGVGVQGFGLLMAASGLGAFLGGLTLARRLRRRPPLPSFLGGLALFLLGLLGLSFCRNFPLALGAIFLVGFGMVTHFSTGNSLLQLNVPDDLRGRLMSLFGLIIVGFAPVGSLFLGTLAHYVGPCPAFGAGSLLAGGSAGLLLLRYPGWRSLDFQDLRPPKPAPLPPNVLS
jgi:MFS family permease